MTKTNKSYHLWKIKPLRIIKSFDKALKFAKEYMRRS